MTLFKKNSLRHIFMFACMTLVAAMLLSCSDDNEQAPDAEPDPETSITKVTIAGIAANARVWDKIMLTLDAESEAGIEKYEIKVDGRIVATLTSAPFQFELNTRDLSDGAHTLSVTATGKDGGQKTVEIPFTVQNVLLHIEVPDDFLEDGARGFIFLSDSLGKTIVAEEYHAGESLELTAPTYTQNTFTLTQVYIESDGYKSLYSFTEVSRGRWALVAGYNDSRQVPNTVDLTFINGSEEGRYDISTNYGGYQYYGGLFGTNSYQYLRDDSKVYIGYADDENGIATRYLSFPSIKALSATIDLATAEPMTIEQYDISAFDGVGYELIATSEEEVFYIGYSDKQYGTLRYSYPGATFSRYLVETRLEKDNKYYRNMTEGGPSLKMTNSDINVALDGNTFTGSVTGEADYCTYTIDIQKQAWLLFTRPGLQKAILPELPSILPDFSADFSHAGIEVRATDMSNGGSYDAFLSIFSEFPGDALVETDLYFTGYEIYQVIAAEKFGRRAARANRSHQRLAGHSNPFNGLHR